MNKFRAIRLPRGTPAEMGITLEKDLFSLTFEYD